VTRTRGRAASRPAGPPAGAADGSAPDATPATTALLGSLGVSPDGTGSEPAPLNDDPSAPAAGDAPVVEHVPVKKKGSRKR
jgi:ribonuclease E